MTGGDLAGAAMADDVAGLRAAGLDRSGLALASLELDRR